MQNNPQVEDARFEAALQNENSPESREVEKLMLGYIDAISGGADAFHVLLVRPEDSPAARMAKRLLARAEDDPGLA